MTDPPGSNSGSGPQISGSNDELQRLRAENHTLIQSLEACHNHLEETERRGERDLKQLREEVASVKRSRVWRLAQAIRSALSAVRPKQSRKPNGAGSPAPPDQRTLAYQQFMAARPFNERARLRLQERFSSLNRKPLISVVLPVRNTEPACLKRAIGSVFKQVYQRWELILVDDGSDHPATVQAIDGFTHPKLKVRRMTTPGGIAVATNEGIRLSHGEFVAFLDHDDELAPDALGEVACAVEGGADFIYSDEDNLDPDGKRINPHFKPDYSPDLLLSHNYITHLVVVSRELLDTVGGLKPELDGAQDYDFVLRAAERARAITHIPKVLYHWRMSESSTSMNINSKPESIERGRRALTAALERRGVSDAEVQDANIPCFYRVKYRIASQPLISIIIPFKDKPELLHQVIGDVLEKNTYPHFEVVAVNNQSRLPETKQAMEILSSLDSRIRFIDFDHPFSFSAIVNHAARVCQGQHLALVNNDIRIISWDWMEAMLEHSQREEVGAVGGKLFFPDGRVQHAGIVVGIGGYAGHGHKGFPADHQGYFNRLQLVHNVSAVTGAFLMVKKALFTSIGGFDEEHFAVACNDVDFCLRLRDKGYWNVYTPFAQAYHTESASRGYEDTPEKKARFGLEKAAFATRHEEVLTSGDPFYNINLTRSAEDFSVRGDE